MVIEYQGSVSNGGGNALSDVQAIDVIRVDGKIFAVVGGSDNRLDVYEIDDNPASPTYGQLSSTPIDTELDDAALKLNQIRAIESLEIDGVTYVFAGGSDNGISSFTIDGAGQLTAVDNATDTGPINMEQVRDLSTVSIDDGAGGTNHFVFTVADGAGEDPVDDDGISVFRVASDGTMTNVDNIIADGTNRLNNPQDIEAVQVDDGAGGTNTFVVAGGNQDGLSVFSVAPDGTLTITDNVLDDATMNLANVRSIDSFEINGTSYIAVGADEGGVSFFEIAPDGTLTNVGNVADDGVLNLAAIDHVYVGDYQGASVLWVAGRDAGLDAYEISVDGVTGEITLNRIATFDSATYDTSDMRALDGDSGFIVAGDSSSSSMSSFTAPCFAPGTMICTPDGPRAVETLKPGDVVMTQDRGAQIIRWIHNGKYPLEDAKDDAKPVLIKAGALGQNLPVHDLIVSPQHRILVGGAGQLDGVFANEAFAPAKSLTAVPGIRHMKGKKTITWHHFACDHHEVIRANGCLSESLLLGPMVVKGLSAGDRRALFDHFGPTTTPDAALNGLPARDCLTVRVLKGQLGRHLKKRGQLATREIRKRDRDLTKEKGKAERLH